MAFGCIEFLKLISEYCSKPKLFAQSTAAFWDGKTLSIYIDGESQITM